jgi:hypothetical protein
MTEINVFKLFKFWHIFLKSPTWHFWLVLVDVEALHGAGRARQRLVVDDLIALVDSQSWRPLADGIERNLGRNEFVVVVALQVTHGHARRDRGETGRAIGKGVQPVCALAAGEILVGKIVGFFLRVNFDSLFIHFTQKSWCNWRDTRRLLSAVGCQAIFCVFF